MGIDVSVVVPVFNTGEFIEPCIASLLGQTLPRERYELIFVDDGSTDDTPARLDRLAAEEQNVVVRHEPNSGWPGRPRNLGIDCARGDYVFFVDHDDWLGDETLERMVAFARRTNADILIPKLVGEGRGVPLELFARNIENATVADDPLMTGLTPHKMFRRGFLDAHGIRFPEGRRRLEDHVFVVHAYLHAERIAVLADYPCYRHTRRPDGGNAAHQRFEPVGYYGNLREVLDIIDAHTSPGPGREALLHRSFTRELLSRLNRRHMVKASPEHRDSVSGEIRRMVEERYPADFVERFGAVVRLRDAALRTGSTEILLEMVERLSRLQARGRLTGLDWDGDAWIMSVRGELIIGDDGPMLLRRSDDGWLADERLVPAGVRVRPDSPDDLRAAVGRLVLIDTESDVEWLLADRIPSKLRPLDGERDLRRLVVAGSVRLDPLTAAAGGPLPPGRWHLDIVVSAMGTAERTRVRLGSAEVPLPQEFTVGSPPRQVQATARDGHSSVVFVVAEPDAD